MTAIERRLLTCRLLDAMTRNPEYSEKLQLKDVSVQKKEAIKRKEINDGKKAQIRLHSWDRREKTWTPGGIFPEQERTRYSK